jgi:ABC-2 type transport system permease protein
MALIALFFTAMGTAIASLLEDMQGFQMIMNFLVMPIFFLSGALFPLTGLPSSIDIIARLNPLTYGVDGLRGALVGGQMQFGFGIDLAVLTGVTVLFLVIGSYLFSKIEI